jgi:glutamate/tyrosine decarboxylase-like PLP-dependent enzyme
MRLDEAFGDSLPPSVVLVAASAHYSWEKIVRALGIGSNQLIFVPIDDRYRLDPDALWERIESLTHRRIPILACVSVCGTTEEGAVDRLDLVQEVRERAARELGVTFHLHSDACYGGYAAALTWDAGGRRRSAEEIRAEFETDTEPAGSDDVRTRDAAGAWPSEGWVRSMEALAGTDSVTIDPHKLGYIPYPAGAIVFRDRRVRELVAVDPPYLLPTQGLGSSEDLFLGRFVFEGSKPGAAAASVWLSHKVLPLDERGYGRLIGRTVVGARRLYRALGTGSLEPFRLIRLPEPDINIVCFVLTHPEFASLDEVNALNEGVYARMSLSVPGAQPEYIITRTRFQTPMYDGAVAPILERLGVAGPDEWKASGGDGLVILRATVMDPFLAEEEGPDHVAGFLEALRSAAMASLEGIQASGGVSGNPPPAPS